MNTQDNGLDTLGTILKIVSVIGLTYLAYQNRSKLSSGWDNVKEGTNKMVQPIADGIKQSTSKFQDFISDKTEDASDAISNLSTQLEEKYNKLQGDAKNTYSKELKTLRDKLNHLIDSQFDKVSTNLSSTNMNNGINKNINTN